MAVGTAINRWGGSAAGFSVTADNLHGDIALTKGNPRFSGATGTGVISGRPRLGRSFRFGVGYRF